MSYSNNPLIKHKMGLLNLAEELGNISRACKLMGMNRDTFYFYQQEVEKASVEAFINQNRKVPTLKTMSMKKFCHSLNRNPCQC